MNTEVLALILTAMWGAFGIGMMWFSNHVMKAKEPYRMNLADEEQQAPTLEAAGLFNRAYGKAISIYSLLLFINAALSVYLPDTILALMITFGLGIIGVVALIIAYSIAYKKYCIHDKEL